MQFVSGIVKILNFITNSFRLLKYIFNYKKTICIIIGCITENSLSLIALGKFINSTKELIYYVLIIAVLATTVDFIILIALNLLFKNYKEKFHSKKPSKLLEFFQRRSFLSTILYRFIPFGRIPFLISTSIYSKEKDFLIPSLIGATLWGTVWVYIGYNSLSKIYIDKVWNFVSSIYKLRLS